MIRDLLYVCVECGREGGLKPVGKPAGVEACDRCGTRYSRSPDGRIRVERPNQAAEVKHPAEWLDMIEGQSEPSAAGWSDNVTVRVAARQRPYYHAGRYLGLIEEFGPPEQGTIVLGSDAITYSPAAGPPKVWALDDITAIQPTSSTLNLKLRRGPLVALRFADTSPLLWEERLRATIQARFTSTGRGEILEYQPRIVCG